MGDIVPLATLGTTMPNGMTIERRGILGIDSEGKVRICLMGHAGQGQSIPLWVRRDDVTLTIQPNDIILRFDDLEIEE